MLLSYTAYQYALDKNKTRQMFDASSTENYDKNEDADGKPNWSVFVLAVFVELVLLFFAIPMALRTARSRSQLFLHLFFAITATPAYLFVAVAFQTPAYDTLMNPVL